MRKSMLVLANSTKRNDRCIAGREIIEADNTYSFGPWIRPYSDRGEGELSTLQRIIRPGREVKVLDFAELSLSENMNNPVQPENWAISTTPLWKLKTTFQLPKKGAFENLLEEFPDNLWIEPGCKTDRVSADYLDDAPPDQSLYLIKAEAFRIEVYTNSYNKVKYRGLFTYNDTDYDLGLTDPLMIHKWCHPIPGRLRHAGQSAINGNASRNRSESS